MTASPTIAADRRSGEGDNTAPRSGIERSRIAARFSEHVEREYFRAICRTGDFVHVRATGVTGLKTENARSKARSLAIQFRSTARTVDASGLRGSVLPAFRRWRSNLCRFLTGWSFPVRFHSAPTVCQDTSRRSVEQSFHDISSLLTDVGNHVRRMRQSAVKE